MHMGGGDVLNKDVFQEQMVKKKPTLIITVLKTGILVLAIILFLAAFFATMGTGAVGVAAAAAIILGFGAYYLISFFNIEYEYIFTSGDLDVDVIYSKSRRKRIYSGDIKDIEIMVHIDETGYEKEFNNTILKNCSSGINSENTYKFAVPYKGKRMQIVFEPNEAMLAVIVPYLGQRKFIKRK